MRKDEKSVLKISLILTFGFFFIELFGGIYTKSLALISDSFHMLLDSFALALTYFSLIISLKSKSDEKTYGYKRAEILSAFFNSLTLSILSLIIIFKAVLRIYKPVEIKKETLLSIAFLGLIVNLVNLFLLHKFQKKSLNIKSAYLHILSDSLGSIIVLTSAWLLYFTRKTYFDSIASIIISFLILITSSKLFIKTLNILMEGVPSNFNLKEVKEDLKNLPSVLDIHDLHIWSVTSSFPLITAHIVIKEEKRGQEILEKANKILKEKYNINHSTIQIETTYQDKCEQANGNCS